MEKSKGEKPRKKVVVEEVAQEPAKTEVKPQIDDAAASTEVLGETMPPKAEVEEAVHHEDETHRIPEKFAPKPAPVQKSGRKYFLLLIPLILILAALGGGIYVFTKNVSNEEVRLTPEPSAYETPLSSPTPTPTPISLTKFTIAIQNGSGIAGEGAKVQTLLTKAGFKVVSLGNAKTYDYTKTIVEAKADVDDTFLSQLTNTLSKTYQLGDNQTLSDSEKTDIVIIVGKTKAQ